MPKTIDTSGALKGLNDPDIQTQEKTAYTMYSGSDVEKLMQQSEIASALRASVRRGNISASAFLLLGHDPSDEALETLKAVEEANSDQLTKLNAWDKPIKVADALLVPLIKVGDPRARDRLLNLIESADTATLTFLLQVLPEIDSPEVLHALSRTLDDETVIGGGAPHGIDNPRRLADAAADAFIERLRLELGFKVNLARRYDDKQLATVKVAIKNAIPR